MNSRSVLTGGSPLLPTDLALHDRLGIPADLLGAVAQRVNDQQARALLGVQHTGDLSGVAYARLDPDTGFARGYRVRRDHPEIEAGKPRDKYLSSRDRAALFFAPDIAPLLSRTDVPVIIGEAEKGCLAVTAAARRLDRPILAIALGGCWGWRARIGKETAADGTPVDEKGPLPDWNRLTWTDRKAVIVFDANAATNKKVQAARHLLAEHLRSLGADVRIAELPIEPGINGPDDFIAQHGDAALFARLDAAAPVTSEGGGKQSQATVLLGLARDAGVTCFRDDDVPYLRVPIQDHDEIMPLRSRATRAWLQGLYVDATDKCARAQAIADASSALEAAALRGPNERVYVRIASTADAIYLDLGDATWRVVEVRASGWRVVSSSPVPFRRPKGLLPLPMPQRGGRIDALRPFVNVPDDTGFVLLISTLLAMLRGRGPYPVLVIDGEQGSAKSTLCRIIKALIDPNVAPLRSEPRSPRDLAIAANNNHVLAFDNLSEIRPWLSDCFCRLSTGGGFSTRKLYEDAEEQIFDAMRPLVVNGIEELATRPDLASRAVVLSLPRLSDQQSRDERTFWAEFEEARPRILGALLDIAAAALGQEASVRLDRMPRMADFAVWAVAAEAACPWSAGTFMQVYAGNREEAARAQLEGHPVADLARALAVPFWRGTAADLLTALNDRTDEAVRQQRDWKYKTPRDVSSALTRIAPNLRIVGINVTRPPRVGHQRHRIIKLEKVSQTSSASSASSAGADSFDIPDDNGGRSADDADAQSSAPSSAPDADFSRVSRDADDADGADAVEPVYSGSDDDTDGRF